MAELSIQTKDGRTYVYTGWQAWAILATAELCLVAVGFVLAWAIFHAA